MNQSYDYPISETEQDVINTTGMTVNTETLYILLNNVYQFAEDLTSEYLKDTTVRERLITHFPDPQERFSDDTVVDLIETDPTEFFELFQQNEPELFQEIVNGKAVALYLIEMYNTNAKFLASYYKIRGASQYSLDELVDMYAIPIAQAALLQNHACIPDLFSQSRKAPVIGM